jgi:uncharacterized coiled-coil protein SlyX
LELTRSSLTIALASTAHGAFALFSNTTGASNNAFGDHALFANTTGFLNVAVGSSALVGNTSGNNNIGIGFFGGSGVTTASNVIAIGTAGGNVDNSCFIGGVTTGSISVANSASVFIDLTTGQLATALVNADGNRVVPSLPGTQQQAMLNRKVEEQQATIVELKSAVAQQQKVMEVLTAQLKAQAAQIQKVSARLELSRSVPQTVLNNQ